LKNRGNKFGENEILGEPNLEPIFGKMKKAIDSESNYHKTEREILRRKLIAQ
jgi:hypothetical protein